MGLFKKISAGTVTFQQIVDSVHLTGRAEKHFRMILLACSFLKLSMNAASFVGAVKSGKTAVDTAAAQ